jgi:hypothetical protein
VIEDLDPRERVDKAEKAEVWVSLKFSNCPCNSCRFDEFICQKDCVDAE